MHASSDQLGVTIVTQTRIKPGADAEFGRIQAETAIAARNFAGFVEQSVIRPVPPAQLDWVTMQWFSSAAEATEWLRSEQRHEIVERASALTTGRSNTYLVNDREAGTAGTMATAVIATNVHPGCEADYRAWQQRVAHAASRAAGYQGHRMEPPIDGVQDHWLSVLWFDSDEHLQAWLSSPERAELVREVKAYADIVSSRPVATGLEQWFDAPADQPAPPTWKMSMIALLNIYPAVFLIDTFLVPPLSKLGAPFWLTLFVGNLLTVTFMAFGIPFTGRRFGWWLGQSAGKNPWPGAATIVGLYALLMAAFAGYSALR